MANHGILFPPLGLRSQMGTTADNAHIQNQPIDEYAKGDFTEVGGIRTSGTRTAQTVTPATQGTGPSAPASLVVPEGETPTSLFAKSQATLNAIYAQQGSVQTQTQQTPFVAPMPRQLNYETPH
ncbi:hypothetical protein Hanom_Chr02g00139071 [Helianthus anomalus]